MRGIKIVCYILFVLVLSSCDPNRLYQEYQELPEGIWSANRPVEFKVNIEDASKAYNLYVNLRHSGAYKYSNLYLFIETEHPSGYERKDTLQCILANPDGRWLGSGLGDIFDIQIPFKQTVKFTEPGVYLIRLDQAQRYGQEAMIERLEGIKDVGLRVEYVQ